MKDVIIVRSNSITHDPRVKKEALSLANNGYDVSILGRDKENEYELFEELENCKIYRYNYKIGRLNLVTFKTILLPFSIFLWWIYEVYFLFNHDWDVVHSCDFDTLLPAIIAAKIKRKKIIYDIFDVYGDMLTFTNIPKTLLNLLKFAEEFLIRFVDVTILVDVTRKDQLKNAKFKKVVYVMNTPKSECNNVLEDREDGFIIFYGGLIAKERGLIQIINAIKDLPNIKLIIAGFGYGEDEILPIINKNKNTEFIGRIPHSKVLEYTKKADLLFALYDPKVPNNAYASPNKLFEAMLCKKPIIVNEGTSMAKIVEEENCGLIVPYDDVKKIRNSILSIKNDENLKALLGENGRKAYENKYNWDMMEKRLLEVYGELNK